jgi:FKBP-type peptidyl-prolyl cis-trans isomerase FkpA
MQKFPFLFLTIILLFVACNSDSVFKIDQTGLKFKFIEKKEDGRKPVIGDILILKMIYRTESDSVLFDYHDNDRLPRMQLVKPSHQGGCFEDGLAMLNQGDSIVFFVDAAEFFSKTRKMPVPEYIKSGEKIRFEIRLAGIQSFSEVQSEHDAVKHSNADDEMKMLDAYLKRANITKSPSNSGLYFVESIAGKGKKAQAGKKLRVHYTGKFIDGQIFDSSVERHEPFEFTLGVGQVIQGWDEGFAQMSEGGKARLIIPSHIAYGDKQRGPIAPFSTLIFEVELIKVLN